MSKLKWAAGYTSPVGIMESPDGINWEAMNHGWTLLHLANEIRTVIRVGLVYKRDACMWEASAELVHVDLHFRDWTWFVPGLRWCLRRRAERMLNQIIPVGIRICVESL